jgi:O-antigen ligase
MVLIVGTAGVAALVVMAGLSSARGPALAIVGAVMLAALIWASGNPRLACLWGVGLAAPLGIAKRFHPMPHMGGAGAYAIEVVDPFLLILCLFQWRDRVRGMTGTPFPHLAIYSIVMILLGLIDAIAGPYRQLALVEAVQMAKSLALFLLLLGELTRVRRFLHFCAALACGLLLQAAVGIAQYGKKGDIGLQFLGEATMTTLQYANRATYMDGGATFRIGGLLGHPNILAGFIAMLAPLLLALLMTRLPPRWKMAIAAVLATALAALLLTLSRSGWLAFALAAPIVMGLMLRDSRSRQRALAGSTIALAVGLIGTMAAAPAIVRRFTQSDPGAVDFRWDWMAVAWGMVRDHPLLGVGLNSFVLHLPGRTIHGGTDGLTRSFGANWPVVHDIYLLIWAEQGTIGFACFLLLLIALLRTGWRNAGCRIDPLLHAINAGALAGLCANLLDGFGSFFLRQMPGARLFWILAAMIVAIRTWQRRTHMAGPL